MKTLDYVVEYVEPGEPTTNPQPGIVYIERDVGDTEPDVVQFLCPCGCPEVYRLNLDKALKAQGHTWELTVKDGKPTLHPSVNFTAGCKSHFNMLDGKIAFCG